MFYKGDIVTDEEGINRYEVFEDKGHLVTLILDDGMHADISAIFLKLVKRRWFTSLRKTWHSFCEWVYRYTNITID